MINYSLAIQYLITGILVQLLGLFVYSKNPKIYLNKIFGIFCFIFSIWLYAFFFLFLSKYENSAIFWTKIMYIGVSFSATIACHFVRTFLNINNKRYVLWIFYLISSIFSLLNIFTSKFINGLYIYQWGYYPKAGILHPIFMIYIFIETYYSISILYKRFKQKRELSPAEFERVKYVFVAFALGHLVIINFLGTYGINVYPYAHLYMAIFFVITAYAIIRHQLMDINVVIRKSLVYSILIAIITALYLVMVVVMERFFQGFAGYRSLSATLIVAFIIALGFNPVRNRIQKFVDRHFFRGSAEVLQKQVEQLEGEMRRADRLKAVGTLAAGMAHEIRNPLTAIRVFAEAMPEKYNDSNFRDKFQKIVTAEVDRIDHLIKQLLDFAKPSPPIFEDVNLSSLIDETLSLLEAKYKYSNIDIVKDYPAAISIIQADSKQLKQVFLNLFLNAIDAIEKVEDRKLVISLQSTDDAVVIRIKDSGLGMTKDDLRHIFEPFYTKKDKGTGLGLFIVYNIIQKHNGTISVESQINKATTFTIKLPRKKL